jgi:hypothetical protein
MLASGKRRGLYRETDNEVGSALTRDVHFPDAAIQVQSDKRPGSN